MYLQYNAKSCQAEKNKIPDEDLIAALEHCTSLDTIERG